MKHKSLLIFFLAACLLLTACGQETSTQAPTIVEPLVTIAPQTSGEGAQPLPTADPAATQMTTIITGPPATPPQTSAPIPSAPAAPVDASFFNDAVFVGDSVTLKLRNYAASSGAVGNAAFLCAGSFSAGHAVNNTLQVSYQGSTIALADGIQKTGAKKVFLMLGLNDIGIYGIDGTIENWYTMTDEILAKNPDVQIYIQSVTPIYEQGQSGSLTNENFNTLNEKLKAFAAEKGFGYIDIATSLKNDKGHLEESYCSDEYVHLTDAGCQVWVECLIAYFNTMQ